MKKKVKCVWASDVYLEVGERHLGEGDQDIHWVAQHEEAAAPRMPGRQPPQSESGLLRPSRRCSVPAQGHKQPNIDVHLAARPGPWVFCFVFFSGLGGQLRHTPAGHCISPHKAPTLQNPRVRTSEGKIPLEYASAAGESSLWALDGRKKRKAIEAEEEEEEKEEEEEEERPKKNKRKPARRRSPQAQRRPARRRRPERRARTRRPRRPRWRPTRTSPRPTLL